MPALVQREVIRPQIAITQALLVAALAQLVAAHQAIALLAAVIAAEAPEAAEVDLVAADLVVAVAEAVDRHQAVAEAVAVDNLI